jgi:hypothetical protein
MAGGCRSNYSEGGEPRDKTAGIRCPGEEVDSSPRRDLRERQLPWVFLIMIDDLVRGKALAKGLDGAAAC